MSSVSFAFFRLAAWFIFLAAIALIPVTFALLLMAYQSTAGSRPQPSNTAAMERLNKELGAADFGATEETEPPADLPDPDGRE